MTRATIHRINRRRRPQHGVLVLDDLGGQKGLLDYNLSDVLDMIPEGGAGKGKDGKVRPLGRVVIDADPEVLKRIDLLTAQVARMNANVEQATRGAGTAGTFLVVGVGVLATVLVVTRRRR